MRGKADQSGGYCSANRVVVDARGELPIELDDFRGKLENMGEARETGARVVDGESNS